MGWFQGISKKNFSRNEIPRYPSQTYRRVLCSRPHCTEACFRPHHDKWKFWALFLSSSKVKYPLLFANIALMPDAVRLSVYSKCLKVRRIPRHPSQENSDSLLSREIISRCQRRNYYNPHRVFLIFKGLSGSFPVHFFLLDLILDFLSLPGASPRAVYGILYGLFAHHGLEAAVASLGKLSVIASDRETKKAKLELADCEMMIDPLSADGSQGAERLSPVDDQKDIETPTILEHSKAFRPYQYPGAPEELSPEAVREVWRIILQERQNVFFILTDLVIALRCEYNQIIRRAARVSRIFEPREIVGVLAGKRNYEYYAGEYVERPAKPRVKNRRSETYFDYLVVQNNLIASHVAFKKSFDEKYRALQEENIRLKMENRELQNTLENMKIRTVKE